MNNLRPYQYVFNESELHQLVRIFRSYEGGIPRELYRLNVFALNCIRSTMTIEEANSFFAES